MKTTVDGIVFASAKEARRYQELKLLEKAGEVRKIELQPEFPLTIHAPLGHPQHRERWLKDLAAGKTTMRVPPVKIGEYRADFRYEQKQLSACENDRWATVVEDVKGFKTPLYKWKKKHVEAQYGIQIREI